MKAFIRLAGLALLLSCACPLRADAQHSRKSSSSNNYGWNSGNQSKGGSLWSWNNGNHSGWGQSNHGNHGNHGGGSDCTVPEINAAGLPVASVVVLGAVAIIGSRRRRRSQ